MTKKNWKESSSALRHLLKDLPLRGEVLDNSMFQYKFGAFLHRDVGWVVYNGITDNVIAVIKRRNNRLSIRYRPNSKYACIFKNRVEGWDSFRIARVPSSHLSRYRGSARDRLSAQVAENIQQHRSDRRAPEPAEGSRATVDHVVELMRSQLRDSVPIEYQDMLQLLDTYFNRWAEEIVLGVDYGLAYYSLNNRFNIINYPDNRPFLRWADPSSTLFTDVRNERQLRAVPNPAWEQVYRTETMPAMVYERNMTSASPLQFNPGASYIYDTETLIDTLEG